VSQGAKAAPAGVAVGLRSETPADRAFLFELYASTRWEELRPVPWTDEQKRAFLAMQFDAQWAYYRAAYDGALWDVITVGGGPAGRLYVCRFPDQLRIVDISLQPEYRGLGIGTYLLRSLITEGDSSGLSLSVHVEHGNPAVEWYRRLGFNTVEVGNPYLYMERPPSALVG
jgi:ribosomal protein S18 acetylase RimI-like enzyme